MKALFSRLRQLLPGSPEADDVRTPPFRLKRILSEKRTAGSARYLDGSIVQAPDAEAEGVKPLYDLSVYRSSEEDLALLLDQGESR